MRACNKRDFEYKVIVPDKVAHSSDRRSGQTLLVSTDSLYVGNDIRSHGVSDSQQRGEEDSDKERRGEGQPQNLESGVACLSPKLNPGRPCLRTCGAALLFFAGLRWEAPDYSCGRPSFDPSEAGLALNSSICRSSSAFSRSRDSRDRKHVRII